MINWQYIMLHHSLTKDAATVSWDDIRRYHMSWKFKGDIITHDEAQKLTKAGLPGVESPWSDIGYHFGVELVDSLYTVQKGRPLSEPGAHCKESAMNRLAIGICVVGNFDLAPPPDAQLSGLRALVQTLMQDHNISLERVVLHREYASYKTCPGKLFPVEEFLSSLQQNQSPWLSRCT